MVCTQPGEPLCDERLQAVSAFCSGVTGVRIRVEFLHAKMPQYPRSTDDHAFWTKWTAEIVRRCGSIDTVFSSESYGRRLAEALGASNIVVDPHRVTRAVNATLIRHEPIVRFDDVLPEFRRFVTKTVTIFGAESVGKTTLANAMYGDHVTEWARPFLESMPTPDVTDERMATIVTGQFVSQVTARDNAQFPVIVQDTDLLSTIGYYRIYNKHYADNADYLRCVRLFRLTKSDLYIMLRSDVPFVPNPLRYGGDRRESSDIFWIELLQEFNCNYYIMDESSHRERLRVANNLIQSMYADQPIWSFVRDKSDAA